MTPDLIVEFERELACWPALQSSGLLNAPPVETLSWPLFSRLGITVDVLRTDCLHPQISGNKWFKLKYNLVLARRRGCRRLLSFGGPWSNHLHALAQLAQMIGMESVGIVRGDELDATSNPMLAEAAQLGMQLRFVSRQQYRAWTHEGGLPVEEATWLIPEGGDNAAGLLGCMSLIPASLHNHYDQVWLALGTGCTFAGVRLALPERVRLCGVSVLAGDWPRANMTQRLQQWGSAETANWDVLTQYHAGGYGTAPDWLLSFAAEFGDNTGVPLDPVYTGKAMWALCDQIKQGKLVAGTRALFIHTGGLQGARGFSSSFSSTSG